MPYVLVFILAVAFAAIEALIGGVRLVHSLPSYAVFSLAGLCAVGAWKREGGGPYRLCAVLAVALAAFIAVRSRFSPVDYLARPDFYMVLGALVVYLIAAFHLTEIRHRLALVWVLVIFGLAHAAVGAVQFKETQNFMLLPWMFRPDYGYRASGFYICPNHLAGLLEMLGMLALGICCWSRNAIWVRFVAGYTFVVCIGGVAITASRGGYLSTIFAMLIFAVLSLWVIQQGRRSYLWVGLAAAGLVVVVMVVGALTLIQRSDSLKARLDRVYDPTNMRLLLWDSALLQFQSSPVFGTGSGTFLYYGRQLRDPGMQDDPEHVHNDYLELLAEYGATGVLLLAGFVVVHLAAAVVGVRQIVRFKLRPTFQMTSNELALLIGSISAIAALVIHSVIDFNLHIPANTLLVALLFGFMANPVAAPEGAPVMRPRGRLARFFAPAAGLLLLVTAAPGIRPEYLSERARAALRDENYPDSISYAERALERERSNPDLFYYYGEAQRSVGVVAEDADDQADFLEGAAAAFEQGLQLFPNDIRTLLTLGSTYDQLGKFDEAEATFQRAFQADPNLGNVYAYYGLHWHLQGELDLADRFYKKARILGETELSKAGLEDLAEERQAAETEMAPEEAPPANPEDAAEAAQP